MDAPQMMQLEPGKPPVKVFRINTEIDVMDECVRALNRLGDDAAGRERVLRYLLSRYWPKGVERIVFIGKDKTALAEQPSEQSCS